MKRIGIMIMIIMMHSCSWLGVNNYLTPEEYTKWMKENIKDYSHNKKLGGYNFNLVFQPRESVIISELGSLSNVDQKYVKQRDSSLSGLLSCRFVIEPIDYSKAFLDYQIASAEEYGARLNYFLNSAQNDVFLLQGNDTFKCKMYHFENTYGLQKNNAISMLFEEPSLENGDFEFVFADRVLNVGTVIFTQEINKFKNTPKLKLN